MDTALSGRLAATLKKQAEELLTQAAALEAAEKASNVASLAQRLDVDPTVGDRYGSAKQTLDSAQKAFDEVKAELQPLLSTLDAKRPVVVRGEHFILQFTACCAGMSAATWFCYCATPQRDRSSKFR